MPRGTPPVGYPVQFFKDGDKSGKPAPAIVAESFPTGQCTLQELQTKGSGGTILRRHVFLHGDPELKKRENWATQYGVWDYVPGMKKEGYVDDKVLIEAAEREAEAVAKMRESRAKKTPVTA